MSLVQAALLEQPEDSLAHATRGFYLYGERNQRNTQPLLECVENSRKFLNDNDARAKHYCNALQAASTGDLAAMVFHLEQQLVSDPLDIIALKLCQSELFWLGEMQWSASISASVENHWNKDQQYYSDYLAIRAFDLEETGDQATAEQFGRESVAINPADVWGTHAVAHVMYMQGRGSDGAQWLDTLSASGNWDDLGQMVLHLWWHRALFHVLNGELEAALGVYDDYLRNFDIDMIAALPDLYLDLQNATSLLIRLEMLGIDVGDRWSGLADTCEQRIDDCLNPFSSAHYAVVLASDQRFEKAQQLIDYMQQASVAGQGLSPSFGNAAVPAAIASVAHRKKDFQQVIEILMPVRYRLVQMGGSYAQREVFMFILADAIQKVGDSALLSRLSADLQETGFSEIMANRIQTGSHA